MGRTRRVPLTFLVTLALFISATLGITAYTLWLLRADAIKSGLEMSAFLARNFGDHLTQSLRLTELAGVNAASSENGQLNLRQIEKNFMVMLRHSPHLRSLSLLDESNRIIVSSNPSNKGVAVATTDFYPATIGSQSILRIGPPWAGRDFADLQAANHPMPGDASESLLPITQEVAIGSRNLTLLVALNPDYFLNHMAMQFDTKAGSVVVMRLDGLQLMATGSDHHGDVRANESERNHPFNEVEFGQFEQILQDERPVLTAFRVSPLYSFAVVTHVQRDYALRQWMTQTKTILGIVAPTLMVMSLLGIAFYRRELLLSAKTAEANRLQKVNAACVFTNSHEGIMIVASDGCIIDVNAAFTRITGYSRGEVLGQNPRILSSGWQTKEFYADLWRSLSEHGFWNGEIWNRHKNGAIFAEMLSISVVPDSQGVVQQFVAQFSDITERKVTEDQVRLMAFQDPLTMLPNRRMLNDRLNQVMAASKRSGLHGALMFLDLDNFKPLNDTHGHEVGDLLLIEVSKRLKDCLREVDTVARFGGDEFVVLLGELDADKSRSTEQTRIVAEKIRASLAAPYLLTKEQPSQQTQSVEHHCSTSIGVVVFINQDYSQTDILKWADEAMYQAKNAGRNMVMFYQGNRQHQNFKPRPTISACVCE